MGGINIFINRRERREVAWEIYNIFSLYIGGENRGSLGGINIFIHRRQRIEVGWEVITYLYRRLRG